MPSHERPLRLRWLLNALEEQSLDPARWEVVIVHDSRGDETETLLDSHPVRARVELRHRRLPPGTGSPPRQRNFGWGMARAPLVAFTDDDCRPEPGWLAALLAGAARHPGAIVQGTTRPDPFELDLLAAPHARSLWVDPPGPFGQTANILYPRELLERLEGFDETFLRPAGEDTDLLWRAKELGASLVAAPDAVVNHAVAAFTALGMVRLTPKWLDLPRVVGRHPGLRKTFPLGRFWRERHGWLLLGTLGSLATRSTTARLLLALPYLRLALARDGARLRSLPRAVAELPGRVAVDFAELAVLTAGSIRHRTMFL